MTRVDLSLGLHPWRALVDPLTGRSRLRIDRQPEERPLPEWVGAVGHYRTVPAGTPVSKSVRASSR
jgi:hypothetical protein